MINKEFFKLAEEDAVARGFELDEVLGCMERALIGAFKKEHGNTSCRVEFKKDRNEIILYSYIVEDLDYLPLFLGFGPNLSIIEPEKNDFRYAYTFRSITKEGQNYDLSRKFPITIDGDTLTYSDNIYIKYVPSENVFVMLVSDSKEFCEKKSDSNEVAYYVFHIKYDYVEKNFTNPKFIRKVYKKDGCKYVDDLMEG